MENMKHDVDQKQEEKKTNKKNNKEANSSCQQNLSDDKFRLDFANISDKATLLSHSHRCPFYSLFSTYGVA